MSKPLMQGRAVRLDTGEAPHPHTPLHTIYFLSHTNPHARANLRKYPTSQMHNGCNPYRLTPSSHPFKGLRSKK